MIQSFADTIKKYNMVEEGDIITIGVSGGADSLCLLFNLWEYKREVNIKLQVVHVNHLYRSEADMEESYVENLCGKLGIACTVIRKSMENTAKENHMSLEEAGRKIRYEAFAASTCNKIAVAHNSNDCVETVLMNLCRGTGIRGMAGIEPVNGKIIRPLLYTDRTAIEEYLKKNHILYCIDKTNLMTDFTRNKVRLRVLPYIRENINEEVFSHVMDLAGDMFFLKDYITEEILRYKKQVDYAFDGNKICVDLQKFSELHNFIKGQLVAGIIGDLVPRKDISRKHINSVIKLSEKNGEGYCRLPYGLFVYKNYKSLNFGKNLEVLQDIGEIKSKMTEAVPFPALVPNRMPQRVSYGLRKLDIQLFEAEEIREKIRSGLISMDEKYTKWLDYGKINGSAVIRYRKPGDYIYIDKENHRKSLKDFMIDRKIPKSRRDLEPCICDGNRVILAGEYIGYDCRIRDNTKFIVKIVLQDA